MKIAVIGSGISGMAVAWLLSKKFEVDIYEKNNYLGGHSNTIDINYDGTPISVDTGFIVFNHKTYPNLTALFEHLNVKTVASVMSFSASINQGQMEYCGKSLAGVFSQKKNIFNPQFLLMLRDILRFNRYAPQILKSNSSLTLEQFLDELKLGKYFREFYLLPMSAAIWSCPISTMKNYPAKSFVQFFLNHGLLSISDQPIWHSVLGGSKEYIKLLCKDMSARIFLNQEIKKIERLPDGKLKICGKIYDKAIIASHSDQALAMISDFNSATKNIIAKFKYQKNTAVLHRDENLMPKNKNAWASWNYLKDDSSQENQGIALSYWMNNLQKIDKKFPLFVTLNSDQKIAKDKIFAQIEYEHPIFDQGAIVAQEEITKIQGLENLYFCGAYQKYGFHEDGLNSAISVAKKFNVSPPWKQ